MQHKMYCWMRRKISMIKIWIISNIINLRIGTEPRTRLIPKCLHNKIKCEIWVIHSQLERQLLSKDHNKRRCRLWCTGRMDMTTNKGSKIMGIIGRSSTQQVLWIEIKININMLNMTRGQVSQETVQVSPAIDHLNWRISTKSHIKVKMLIFQRPTETIKSKKGRLCWPNSMTFPSTRSTKWMATRFETLMTKNRRVV